MRDESQPVADPSQFASLAALRAATSLIAGLSADQVLQVAGIRIPGPAGDGGRIPDITVSTTAGRVWLPLTELALVIEIVSPGSEGIDQAVKVHEYAMAGIPRHWTISRDAAQTVTMHRLDESGEYEVEAKQPRTWLLQTDPADHQLAA